MYWISYRRAGKTYSESVKSPTCDGTLKKDALTLLREREGDIGRGKPITPQIGKTSFEDASADILADYRINDRKSLDSVERRIRLHLSPFFHGWRMVNISTPDIRKFADIRTSAGASNAEVNRELALLKRMFSLAMQGGKLLYRPHIPMLRESAPRSGFFEADQLTCVLAHLPVEIQPIITFAYITGWRINSEVLPLQWRQIDFAAGEVRLDAGTTKNQEGRVFPFTAELRTMLQTQHLEHLRLAATGLILPWVFTRDGAQIRDFRTAWAHAIKAAGCPGRIPHDLRRTAVRNLVRAGVSEQVAMRLTGHKTRSVFDRYDIVSGNDLKEAARKLDVAAGLR
ncbi:MAG: hypothetical protein A3H96_04305 [Acidobacteria bacterium RIFCSPLOWO2_02_FULL_67_36]|nr:MAG: hypothetical protein A3H96_04305 [Acidobacteria bacterium RIFCSPLOWO2_02_FULL_67_36]OFW26333.1 MAG: hypothetical protein A3G21_26950 [Acidobacteria bacterium RIFCSPLOWO2_12_FULL_66_21]